MRRFSVAISAISSLALVQIASAADLPRKAPAVVPVAPPVLYNWSGFYVGGNIGYGWGRAHSDITSSGIPIDEAALTDLVGVCPAGCPSGPFTIPGFAVSNTAKLNGVIGGGQLGYNWQASPNWVLGFETDFQGSGQKRSITSVNTFDVALPDGQCNAIPCSMSGSLTTNHEAKLDWFGTVRGRIGYAADRVFVYGTGGLAYGHLKISGVNTTNVTISDCCEPHLAGTFVTPFSASKTKVGWTAGAGVEVAAWDRWSWKFEYLYMDLGRLQTTVVNGGTTIFALDTHFTDNIVRAGLNYRFGG